MNNLLAFKMEFYIDAYGILRVKNLSGYEVIGLKIKPKGKINYIFPMFSVTIRKK